MLHKNPQTYMTYQRMETLEIQTFPCVWKKLDRKVPLIKDVLECPYRFSKQLIGKVGGLIHLLIDRSHDLKLS